MSVQDEIGQLRARIRLADDQYCNRGHSDVRDTEDTVEIQRAGEQVAVAGEDGGKQARKGAHTRHPILDEAAFPALMASL